MLDFRGHLSFKRSWQFLRNASGAASDPGDQGLQPFFKVKARCCKKLNESSSTYMVIEPSHLLNHSI